MDATRKVNIIEYSAVTVLMVGLGGGVICYQVGALGWPSWAWGTVIYASIGVAIALGMWAASLALARGSRSDKQATRSQHRPR